MELKLGPEIVSSYKRLAYEAWYALAEFVDNSTQAYFNNKKALEAIRKNKKPFVTVKITTEKEAKGGFLRIEDDSIGMSEKELLNAVHIGRPPIDTRGRSRYGLGLKTGACWFGDLWTITTKKLGEKVRYKVTFDVNKVANGNLNLPTVETAAPASEHGTTIEIRDLHRNLSPRTLTKVKTYLSSLYRRDLAAGMLCLEINGEKLKWERNFEDRILKLQNGKLAKTNFKFKVGKKTVEGWAAVLEKGARSDAGFSILQSNRVILGWPACYKPSSVFGNQEGGVNDLVNQRLFGELILEEFEVSHTKDQILYEDGEMEDLEAQLREKVEDLRQLAQSHRKTQNANTKKATPAQRNAALNQMEDEMKSDALADFLKTFEPPPPDLIEKTNAALVRSVTAKSKPDLKTKINKTAVLIYLVQDMSPYDPYVLIESTKSSVQVIVILNLNHPHWTQLTSQESIYNFIRHCTYDGVAESKAFAKLGKLEPNTIKLLKDNLLRIPLILER